MTQEELKRTNIKRLVWAVRDNERQVIGWEWMTLLNEEIEYFEDGWEGTFVIVNREGRQLKISLEEYPGARRRRTGDPDQSEMFPRDGEPPDEEKMTVHRAVRITDESGEEVFLGYEPMVLWAEELYHGFMYDDDRICVSVHGEVTWVLIEVEEDGETLSRKMLAIGLPRKRN